MVSVLIIMNLPTLQKNCNLVRPINEQQKYYTRQSLLMIFYESFQYIFPILKKYTRTEIRTKTSKFNYRNIIEYLYDLFYIKKTEQGTDENFLINLIPEYSDLSSYVHGGPAADNALMKLSMGDKTKISAEITDVFFNAIMLSTHFCSLLYMFSIKYEEKYKEHFIKLHRELKKLLKLKS